MHQQLLLLSATRQLNARVIVSIGGGQRHDELASQFKLAHGR